VCAEEVAGESAWVALYPPHDRLAGAGLTGGSAPTVSILSFGLTTAPEVYAERRRKKRPVQDRP
jgi:hypothetical protein